MKITHILQNLNIGGVQKFVLSLIPDPCLTHDTFSAIFTRNGAGVLLESFISKNVRTINFPGKLKPFRPSRFYLWAKRHYHRLYDFLLPFYAGPAKPDIIHTHLYDLFEVSSHLRVATKFQIPFVWTIHGEVSSEASGFANLANALRNAVKKDVPIAIIYVGVKPSILDDLEKYQEIQIKHIPTGINLDEFSNISGCREVNRNKFGYSKNDFVFGYSGRLSWEKGVDILISTFSQVVKEKPNLQLLIAGDGSERTKLIHMVRNSDLEKNIQFVGEVRNIVEVLSALDAYVQPSRTEGLPLSILEAMACKLPIIAANVGGIPNLITDGVSGLLIPPEDPFSLAQAMLRLVDSKSMLDKLPKACSEIIGQFDISYIRSQYQAIYEQLYLENKHKKTQ